MSTPMPDAVRDASAHILTSPSLLQLLAAKRGHRVKAEAGLLLGELTSDRALAAKKEEPAPAPAPSEPAGLLGELAEEEEGMGEEPERQHSPSHHHQQQPQDPYDFPEE